jgi:hypothetical protein
MEAKFDKRNSGMPKSRCPERWADGKIYLSNEPKKLMLDRPDLATKSG